MSSAAATGGNLSKSDLVRDYIMHHVQDSEYWKPIPHDLFKFDALKGIISLHGIMAILAATFLVWLFGKKYNSKARVPTGTTNALEMLILFVRDEIVVPYLGEKDGRKLTPLFLNFFFFILTMNLMGLIPIFASATGNISVTAALACVTFGFMTIGAIVKNGPAGFMKAFIPHGVPWPVLILLIPLEMMGAVIKACVLAIRLFANMLAGHIVLFNLIGLIVAYGLAGSPALVLGTFVFFLEIMVAGLQAYIFTMLSAMFIGQMYHPEH